MKITDPDIIKNGEKDLIDAVKEDLDLDAVKQILKDQIARTTLSASGGELVVHNNQVAFRLDFDLNLSGSLMFDRDGNYIPPEDGSEKIDPGPEPVSDLDDTLEDLELDDPKDFLQTDEPDTTAGEAPETGDVMQELSEADLDIDLSETIETEENPLIDDEIDQADLPDTDMPNRDDMDGILQESRDFWEPKDES